MRIPDGPRGVPTVSPSMLRTYGAGGFRLSGAEEPRGCPRQYRALYVDQLVDRHDTPADAIPLRFGTIVHTVLEAMEDGTDPDEAIAAAWEVDLDPDLFTELRQLIMDYISRGATPLDLLHTIATERELVARLYVDEQFGPIDVRGRIDLLALDPEDGRTVHVVDHKSNQRVPSREDVAGDVQLKTYRYLVGECATELGLPRDPQVVVHLNAIRWRDVPVVYPREAMEHWHAWMVAVVRQILRDEDARPVVNSGCPDCPVKGTCPAWAALPTAAVSLVKRLDQITDPGRRLVWRDAANAARLALEKGVKGVDAEFKAQATRDGLVDVGAARYVSEPDYGSEVDLRALHAATGDAFYGMVRTSETAVKMAVADWPPSDAADALAAISRVPVGMKVTRQKRPSQ